MKTIAIILALTSPVFAASEPRTDEEVYDRPTPAVLMRQILTRFASRPVPPAASKDEDCADARTSDPACDKPLADWRRACPVTYVFGASETGTKRDVSHRIMLCLDTTGIVREAFHVRVTQKLGEPLEDERLNPDGPPVRSQFVLVPRRPITKAQLLALFPKSSNGVLLKEKR
jgi:hypothetical protein